MDKQSIERFLREDISKRNTEDASNIWKDNPEAYALLWEVIKANEYPISWRAAWLFEHMAYKNTTLAFSYLNEIIAALPHFTHNGQKRHMLKVIQLYEISENNIGELLNICFGFLMSKTEPVAVKMQSINILFKISNQLPEIKPELISSIEYNLPDSTSGFRNSSKKILNKLKKGK